MRAATPPEDAEVISPELVLVSDPEAARRARAELPDPLSWRLSAAMRLRSAAAAAPPPEPARRGRRALRYVVAAVALALLGYGVVAFAFGRTAAVEGQGAAARSGAAAAHRSRASTAAAAPVPTADSRVAAAASPTVATSAGAAPTTPASTASAPPTATTAPPPAPSGFVPARSWTWSPVPGAAAYVVTFSRNGREVFRTRLHAAVFELPARFRFLPGRYRWRVTAAGAARPLVDSSFVLDAAQAAAANAPTP